MAARTPATTRARAAELRAFGYPVRGDDGEGGAGVPPRHVAGDSRRDVAFGRADGAAADGDGACGLDPI